MVHPFDSGFMSWYERSIRRLSGTDWTSWLWLPCGLHTVRDILHCCLLRSQVSFSSDFLRSYSLNLPSPTSKSDHPSLETWIWPSLSRTSSLTHLKLLTSRSSFSFPFRPRDISTGGISVSCRSPTWRGWNKTHRPRIPHRGSRDPGDFLFFAKFGHTRPFLNPLSIPEDRER